MLAPVIYSSNLSRMSGTEPPEYSEPKALERLAQIRHEIPVEFDSSTFAAGNSNDVWLAEHTVLRVCWRGDLERLVLEAQLGEALPSSVGYPKTLAWGQTPETVWQIQQRVQGATLESIWLDQSRSSLRDYVSQIALAYRSLHEWAIPEHIRALLLARDTRQESDSRAQLLALPVPYSLQLLEQVSRLNWFPPDLLESVGLRLEDLSRVDPFNFDQGSSPLIHGDAGPSNIFVHSGKIVSLLDFEWARQGPIESELVIWLHLKRQADLQSIEFPPVLDWLKEDYPELFASPDIREHLWLYQLAFVIHGVAIWPPDSPESTLVRNHHIHTLRLLVDSPLLPNGL